MEFTGVFLKYTLGDKMLIKTHSSESRGQVK